LRFTPFLKARIEAALAELEDQVDRAAVEQLRGTAREFNRRVGGGALGLRVDVTAPTRSYRSRAIRQPSEATRLDLVCARCGERHAIYGRAGFCWWCGPLAPTQTAKEGLRSLTARLQLPNREDLPETIGSYLEDHGLHEALETDVYVYGLSLVEALLLAVHEEAIGEEVAKPVNWIKWPELLRGVIDLSCPEWDSLAPAVHIRNSIVHRGARVDARLLQNTEIHQQRGERIRIDRGAAADHLAALERLVEVVDRQLPI